MTGRAASALVVLLALALSAAPVRADHDADEPIVARKFGFAEKGASLVITVSFTDVFDARLLEDLSSGFATTLVVRAYVYPEAEGARPVAYVGATLRVVYDLWEERYLVQIDDVRGRRRYSEKTQAEALKRVTQLSQFPVAPLASVPIGHNHFIGLIVEVNPISEELLAEVRRWIAKDADKPRAGGDSSFFGSFVSIFVNPKIPAADRVLKLRSQLFYRVKR